MEFILVMFIIPLIFALWHLKPKGKNWELKMSDPERIKKEIEQIIGEN